MRDQVSFMYIKDLGTVRSKNVKIWRMVDELMHALAENVKRRG